MTAFYKYGFYTLLITCGFLALSKFSAPFPNETVEATNEDAPENLPTSDPKSPAPQAKTTLPTTLDSPNDETRPISFGERFDILEDFFEKSGTRFTHILTHSNRIELSESAVQLFQFTAQQKRSVNAILDEANKSLLKERKKHSETTIQEDGKVKITIHPFIETGDSIMKATYRDLEKAIGSEKFDRFEMKLGDEINRSLRQFGAEVASYTLEVETDRGASPSIRYSRRIELEKGHSSSGGSIKDLDQDFWAKEEIGELISKDAKRHLEDLMKAARNEHETTH